MGIFRLFQKGRISSGKAAESLGMTKLEFLELLAKEGLPYYDWSPEQLEEEFQMAKNVHRRVTDEHNG